MNPSCALPEDVATALRGLGLLHDAPPCAVEALQGGVSCEVWMVQPTQDARRLCVKRPLGRLRVPQQWNAPVERSGTEVEWLRLAARILPGAVPAVIAHDADACVLVLEFLDPATHLLWKAELRDGRADPRHAGEVGRRLARLHAATAGDAAIARTFSTDAAFHALRLDAYLLAAGRCHPHLAGYLSALVDSCNAHRHALVHGDVSPKNILLGPSGPVFLDAETAWYGDPAFDLAFCLNHLLLKCLWNPPASTVLLQCFEALGAAYLHGVGWEHAQALEQRAAALLPGLLLARVDGKSPVEYLGAADRIRVREFACARLPVETRRLDDLARDWRAWIGTGGAGT